MKTLQTYAVALSTIVIAMLFMFTASFTATFAATDIDDEPTAGTPKIKESTALGIANKAYTGTGTFSDIELETEDGVLVFAIEYTEKDGNEVDIKVDAKTGKVVLIESDKDEAVDDDINDTEEDEEVEKIRNMQTLINLLNQLVAILRQQGV